MGALQWRKILIWSVVVIFCQMAMSSASNEIHKQKRDFTGLTLTDGSITYNLWPLILLFFVLYLVRIAKLFGSGDSGSSYGSSNSGSGYGAPSSGYNAPSSGYGAPSAGSSGYNAPSSGYNAPSGGGGGGHGGGGGGGHGGGGGGGGGGQAGYSRFQQIQNALSQPSFLQDDSLLQDIGNENFLDSVLSYVNQPAFNVNQQQQQQQQQLHTPSNQQFNVPDIKGQQYNNAFNTLSNQQFNVPNNQQFNIPSNQQFNIPNNQQFNIPNNQQFNIPSNQQQFNVADVQYQQQFNGINRSNLYGIKKRK